MTDTWKPARVLVAEQIEADHERIVACPWIYLPEQVTPGKPVVSIYRERLDKLGLALQHHLKLDIYVSLTDGKDAESEAEDALDDVLLSLQRLPGCVWSEAQRVTFADAFTGYTVTAVMHSKDAYKQVVLAENRPALIPAE